MDHADSEPASATLIATRHQLHGIAECLLAGPEHRATGEIALRITPGGFSTTAGPEIRLDGLELVRGDQRVAATRSFGDLAHRLGAAVAAPGMLYPDGSGAKPGAVTGLGPAAAPPTRAGSF